ncbi:MAG: diversity-generating retroelement protein bAvd family protein [Bacteroidetes bacterium 4572_77]|nr:MAG: diversity-generating retroelement protein bAvd family protein [Bacteroidetes bacterium 4572_77]
MQELTIQQKTIDMFEYSYLILKQYPKHEKFVLVSEIKNILNNILKLVITGVKKYYKKTTLQDLDVELAKLKVFARMSKNLEYIKSKTYEIWIRKIVEIGRMVGGWIKSVNNK